jgi:trehalose synthase
MERLPGRPTVPRRPARIVHVPVAPLPWERFREVLTLNQAEALERTVLRARRILAGRVVWSVNSTARGGGVAEMLGSLIAYARGAGVDARWVVIEGDPEFFRVTKRLHNHLHGYPGDGGPLEAAERLLYEATMERNALALEELIRPGDIALLHDPQTAGLAGPLRRRGVRVVWRSHVGVDVPTTEAREAWRFLLPFIREAEQYVFSRASFVWDGVDSTRVTVIPPSIDAFSPKNQDLEASTVRSILRSAGVEAGRPPTAPVFRREDGTPGRVDRRAELGGSAPLAETDSVVLQVSRWDRLKDPVGVLEGFARGIAPRSRAHLVVAGPAVAAVTDDPEGREVLQAVEARRAALPADTRERAHLLSLPMDDPAENAAIVNALQRRADVVVQKSLAEGFGLTVSEAMWKGRPVVVSRVGGIQDQIRDRGSGLLVEPRDLDVFADAVVALLERPEEAARLGAGARAEVRDRFLGPRHLTQYVDLFERLLGAGADQRDRR